MNASILKYKELKIIDVRDQLARHNNKLYYDCIGNWKLESQKYLLKKEFILAMHDALTEVTFND